MGVQSSDLAHRCCCCKASPRDQTDQTHRQHRFQRPAGPALGSRPAVVKERESSCLRGAYGLVGNEDKLQGVQAVPRVMHFYTRRVTTTSIQ